MKRNVLLIAIFTALLCSCSPTKKMGQPITPTSMEVLLLDTALAGTHTGIYVYNPATTKALYSYQSDKYFVPASNTKLFSCYVGMKYLGDSLPGLQYRIVNDSTTLIKPTGDPSFLHADFKQHRVLNFLQKPHQQFMMDATNWKEEALGSGWAWNDYDELYMAERSPMPIYGNATTFTATESTNGMPYNATLRAAIPLLTTSHAQIDSTQYLVQFKRDFSSNHFLLTGPGKGSTVKAAIPFVTHGIQTTMQLLQSAPYNIPLSRSTNSTATSGNRTWATIYSQPTDSLLQPMMYRSDNFYAEQTLLMVSNQKLGYMNDRAIIDTLLKTDLKDLPQKPVWVDGSGLSRYNLFSPQDFVAVLGKMKDEFGMERMKQVLPTGGKGTLSSLYKPIANKIFAKTGTLSGQVAISGYLYTQKNTLLIFSILVNNHTNTASNVRKAVEKFIMALWAAE